MCCHCSDLCSYFKPDTKQKEVKRARFPPPDHLSPSKWLLQRHSLKSLRAPLRVRINSIKTLSEKSGRCDCFVPKASPNDRISRLFKRTEKRRLLKIKLLIPHFNPKHCKKAVQNFYRTKTINFYLVANPSKASLF